jgi:hypothetical protein
MVDDDGYNVLGTGTTIINFPKRLNSNKKILSIPTSECDEEIKKRQNFIQNKRGEFISACYDLENYLAQFISEFFFKDDLIKKEMFHELILDATILTFRQKKNLAKQLMEKSPDETIGNTISKENREELFKKVEEVIKIRNALAHGKVIIDYNNNKSIIQYYDSNKQIKIDLELNEDFFQENDKKVVGLSIIFALLKIHNYPREFFKNFIENGSIGSSK